MEHLIQAGYDDLNDLFNENKEIFSNIYSNHFNIKKVSDVANSILNILNVGSKTVNAPTNNIQNNFNIFDDQKSQNNNSVNLLVKDF